MSLIGFQELQVLLSGASNVITGAQTSQHLQLAAVHQIKYPRIHEPS